jgi:hypothetical protein
MSNNFPHSNAPSPQGGYRDDRDAALAQAASLRERNDSLEAENRALRTENDLLRRENIALGGSAATPSARSRTVVVALAAFAILFMAGVGFWLVAAPRPSAQVPVVVPTSMEVSPVVPSSTLHRPT